MRLYKEIKNLIMKQTFENIKKIIDLSITALNEEYDEQGWELLRKVIKAMLSMIDIYSKQDNSKLRESAEKIFLPFKNLLMEIHFNLDGDSTQINKNTLLITLKEKSIFLNDLIIALEKKQMDQLERSVDVKILSQDKFHIGDKLRTMIDADMTKLETPDFLKHLK